MVQTGKIWIFYDSKNKKQSKPLNVTQAQALILNLAQKKNFQAFIWTPGWDEWVDLKSFLEVDQDYFVVPPSIKKKNVDKTSVTKTLTRFKETMTSTINTTVTDNFDQTLLIPIDPDTLMVKEPKDQKDSKDGKAGYTQISKDGPNQKVDYGYFYPDFKAENIDLEITRLRGGLKTTGPNQNSSSAQSSGQNTSQPGRTAEPVKLDSPVSADRREKVRYTFTMG
jgi:hypothetical protein